MFDSEKRSNPDGYPLQHRFKIKVCYDIYVEADNVAEAQELALRSNWYRDQDKYVESCEKIEPIQDDD